MSIPGQLVQCRPPVEATTTPPIRYHDPEYQKAHKDLFTAGTKQPIEQVLPPGVSQTDFNAAIAALVQYIGKDDVFTGEGLRDYVDPYATSAEGSTIPCAAVCPRDIEKLRQVLKICRIYRVPVWTFGRGKNLGYGGSAPVVSGSLALDLHRMDQVLEVNEKFAYAVVEPGVTFNDLYDYVAAHKLKVWPSVASAGWGSVMGNTLDLGLGFGPTAVHHELIAGMEVMLADGSLLRTGQWAKSVSATAHLSKYTFGPAIDGLFLQSNLGIVTKLGIGLIPAPHAMMSCLFSVPEQDDISPVVEVLGDLHRRGILPTGAYCFDIVDWAGMFGARHEWWDKPGPVPEWRWKEIQTQLRTGHWTIKFNLYGSVAINQAHYDEIVRVVSERIPTVQGRFESESFVGRDGETLNAADIPSPHGAMFAGVPSLMGMSAVDFNVSKHGGAGAHGAYSAIVPLDGEVVREWSATSKSIYEGEGFDGMCELFVQEKTAVLICMLVFDRTSREHCDAVERIFNKLFEAGKQRGFSVYRAHVDHMDMVAEQNDYNWSSYRGFVEKIKDTVDPTGILSPGKQGIWPKKYCHLRKSSESVNADCKAVLRTKSVL